jgi:hypothetical protein
MMCSDFVTTDDIKLKNWLATEKSRSRRCALKNKHFTGIFVKRVNGFIVVFGFSVFV